MATHRRVGGIVILDVGESLTIESRREAEAKLRQLVEAGEKKFLINLGEIRRIEGNLIGLISSSYLAVKDVDAELKFLVSNPEGRELLRLVRMDSIAEFLVNEDEAVASFGGES